MAKDDPEEIGFTGLAEQIGDRLVIRLPASASALLPSRGQVAATIVINGRSSAGVVEPDGRRGHWIAVGEGTGLVGGESVPVLVRPTSQWPEPQEPDDFRAARDAAPDTAELWQAITPMARWEWVRWISATANPATRARRIEVAIDKLRAGKRRPCCFDLSSCTDPELARSGKLIEA